MRQLGSNVICVDATHGTSIYDLYLISVLVVDEFGKGIPVVWAISNRKDGCVLTQFFLIIEEMYRRHRTKCFND